MSKDLKVEEQSTNACTIALARMRLFHSYVEEMVNQIELSLGEARRCRDNIIGVRDYVRNVIKQQEAIEILIQSSILTNVDSSLKKRRKS